MSDYEKIIGGSPLWTPKYIPGLVGWFPATKGLVYNGSNQISAWNDQSGGGNNFGPAPAPVPPEYQPTGWNGTTPSTLWVPSQQLRTTAVALRTLPSGLGAPLTVFGTFNLTDGVIPRFLLQWTDEDNSYLGVQFEGNTNHMVIDVNGAGNVVGNVDCSGAHTFVIMLGGASVTTLIDNVVDINDEEIIVINTDNTYLAMCVNAGGTNGYNGLLAELCFSNQKLTIPNGALYQTYAKRSWPGLP